MGMWLLVSQEVKLEYCFTFSCNLVSTRNFYRSLSGIKSFFSSLAFLIETANKCKITLITFCYWIFLFAALNRFLMKLLHRMIDVAERRSNSTMLYLKCKDLRWLKLDIPGVDNCQAVADSINILKKLTGGKHLLINVFFLSIKSLSTIQYNLSYNGGFWSLDRLY